MGVMFKTALLLKQIVRGDNMGKQQAFSLKYCYCGARSSSPQLEKIEQHTSTHAGSIKQFYQVLLLFFKVWSTSIMDVKDVLIFRKAAKMFQRE